MKHSEKSRSKRLDILTKSLLKKERKLERLLSNHFKTVKKANGQPLNDKKNGNTTLDKWEKQIDSICRQKASIEKRKAAIEREELKISVVSFWYDKMPAVLTNLIDKGILVQWRKNPRMMFIDGVEKARIVFDGTTGVITHMYVNSIANKEQYAFFRNIYNQINAEQNRQVS